MKPDIHGVGTHWIRGFMPFQLVRCIARVMLMVLAWSKFGFSGRCPPGCGRKLTRNTLLVMLM
jgi:hypothetical protein